MGRLYDLLPEIYRQKDIEGDGSLQVLFDSFEHLHTLLESDIDDLYENWFIETCEDRFIPDIGALFGLTVPLHAPRRRALVADAAQNARRKGLASTIEDVAYDATGWRARVLLLRERTAITQHLRLSPRKIPGVASVRALREPLSPLSPLLRSAALRHLPPPSTSPTPPPGEGFHPARVGIFLWRIARFPVTQGTAREVAHRPGCYTLHPLGVDMPLQEPVVRIWERTATDHLQAATSIAYADLARWTPSGWTPDAHARFIVDPRRGRLLLRGAKPDELLVSYTYGLSDELGGGAYELPPTLEEEPTAGEERSWRGRVEHHLPTDPEHNRYATLREALDAWSAASQDGVITLPSHGIHELPARAPLKIGKRRLIIEAVDGACPCVLGGLQVEGGPSAALILRGIWIDGPLVARGGLRLELHHCTVNPPRHHPPQSALRSEEDATRYAPSVSIYNSIVGPLSLSSETTLEVRDSVVDGGGYEAIGPLAANHQGACAQLLRTTVLGSVTLRELSYASEVIFDGAVSITHTHRGVIRFSYLPEHSKTPTQHHCYVGAEFQPRFTSTRYGDPGYAQLSLRCPTRISSGAEDGAELGVFHHLHQPGRVAGLRALLQEHVPLGLEPLLFYMD